jgi:hypothetical protein
MYFLYSFLNFLQVSFLSLSLILTTGEAIDQPSSLLPNHWKNSVQLLDQVNTQPVHIQIHINNSLSYNYNNGSWLRPRPSLLRAKRTQTVSKIKTLTILGLFELSKRGSRRISGVSENFAAELALHDINRKKILHKYKLTMLTNDTQVMMVSLLSLALVLFQHFQWKDLQETCCTCY